MLWLQRSLNEPTRSREENCLPRVSMLRGNSRCGCYAISYGTRALQARAYNS